MSAGFYKRRRGILEHIESGAIDLLESGIHDYLLLKANLLIGSECSMPLGICFTSAPAIHAHCRRVSERTIQRCLEHLEQIGLLKTWKTTGKRGNFPVLVCRASVHDLSGNEYRINGAKTIDWTKPIYEPVGEMSGRLSNSVGSLSGNREKRVEKREKKNPAAKTTPAADPRFQPFVDFAFKAFEVKHGIKPSWMKRDFEQLRLLLKSNSSLEAEELERRWRNYLDSTEPFTSKQGNSLAYFACHCDSFAAGPILKPTGGNGNGHFSAGIESGSRMLTLRDIIPKER